MEGGSPTNHRTDEIDALCARAPEPDRPSDTLLYAADAVHRAHTAMCRAYDTYAELASAGSDVSPAPARPLHAPLARDPG